MNDDGKSEMPASVNASIATNAPANAALVLNGFGTLFGSQSMVALMESVEVLVSKVQGGDLSAVEQMLVSQALALQGVFASLAQRASTQGNPRLLQTQLGLALRAQNQARTTLEALIHLKQPTSPTYIGHANIAAQQQVNTRAAVLAGMPGIAGFDQNRLLEAQNEQWLVPGTSPAPGRNDSDVAPVGAIDGAENDGW